MSGHSKWNNIKNKKEKTDAQKAKVFTKIGKEIAICVREGGGDPNSNGKLRELIYKAKASNVPNDNIERARMSGVKYIAEPGGSIRDDIVIKCCDKLGIAMAFTGMRLFHH